MKLIKYVFADIIRSKVLIGFALFLFMVSMGIFYSTENPLKAMSSLLNIILIVLPLFSVVFSVSYYYNAYEFTELILAQPVKRSTLFISQFAGVGIALSAAFLVGCGIPVLLFVTGLTGFFMCLVGIIMIWVFTALSFLAGVYTRDKTRGVGMAILLWFYFVFIYDALVLIFLFSFSNYPLEKPILLLTFLNPVDLSRIIMLMQLDMAAIMGYTGALFTQFLGSSTGAIICFFALLIWIIIPFILAKKRFGRKDI